MSADLLPRVPRDTEPFRPWPDRYARISLALHDCGPVFYDLGAGLERTIVITWPTLDTRATRLDVEGIRSGAGVTVLPWDVSPAVRRNLEKLDEVWPLDRHDVYASGTDITPALRTLRTLPLGLNLDRRIALAVDRWCSVATFREAA